jgi:hypothetical protein
MQPVIICHMRGERRRKLGVLVATLTAAVSLPVLLSACGGGGGTIIRPPKPVYAGLDCGLPTVAETRQAQATHAKRRTVLMCRGRFDARRLLGMRLSKARHQGSVEGFLLQTAILDGRALLTTTDYRPNRVDVVVRNGRIVGIHGVG